MSLARCFNRPVDLLVSCDSVFTLDDLGDPNTVPSNVASGRATASRGVPIAVKADAEKFLVSDIGYPCLRTSTIPLVGPATLPRM